MSFFDLTLKIEIDPLLGNIKKIYTLCFYQLKIGHWAIGIFLSRMGVAETEKY